ncbi:hypothetical protein INS49_009407 [Diaporthe citri]|uniref:uncharacterized protein n=1 Tax=Diaporthe citri TaxID=83186 RepID=UPI001C81656C|nr:uncharacterized protein INS49_009407 [Diaporthe citri]KAG6361183.1 hypothetical protein INS49_009407 [Diaporthe citri]
MAESIPQLQRTICDLTNVLSLIMKRGPDLGDEDDEAPTSDSPTEEHLDEAEFEDTVALGDAAACDIKQNFLDRLAEVLARFKTAKGSGKKRNSDAKHVTSVIMLEEAGSKSATFLCAKNEGLDAVDSAFLKKLEMMERTEKIDRVFDAIYVHLRPRVEYYSTLIRDSLEEASRRVSIPGRLTSREVQKSLHKATYRDWEDNNQLHFRLRLDATDEESISDKAIDCLSDQDEESLVQETYCEIRDLFGTVPPHHDQLIPTRNLLRKLYRILRHPRQRPALKGLLRQAVRNNQRLFKQAWTSMLYLARAFYAAVTFVDLATRLELENIQFRQIPAAVACRPNISDNRSPVEVLAALGCPPPTREWRDFFQSRGRVQEFVRLSSSKSKTVHGEVQLILHSESLAHSHERPTGTILPYVGCSKKCCFFCDLFRVRHGYFQALFRAPQIHTSVCIRCVIVPSSSQRSASTIISRIIHGTSRAEGGTNIFYSTADIKVEFLPAPGTPGYALVMGGPDKQEHDPVPIDEAERLKINHERRTSSLELIEEMPPTSEIYRKLCRACRSAARYRCSNCWTWYCSKDCQRRSWASHVFVCRVPGRPNDVDFLRWVIRRVKKELETGDEERIHNAMLYLLADDHICRTFGFSNCGSRLEVLNLVCLYSTILPRIGSAMKVLQQHLEGGTLGGLMEKFCRVERDVARVTLTDECACVTWFLQRLSSGSFLIPDMEEDSYLLWLLAVVDAVETLNLTQKFESKQKLNGPEADVLHLYIAIQPTLWLVPDVHSSAWVNFGFCYCRSFHHRAKLARRYLELAASPATFDDIVSAYETGSLADLMRNHGIDISDLERQGIRLHRPPPCEYRVYRLMIGVEHALGYETHIDCECDVNYGFHLTRTWERWQLLNFYRYLFQQPGFDPRRMAEATEDPDLEGLENYLNTLAEGQVEAFLRRRAKYPPSPM